MVWGLRDRDGGVSERDGVAFSGQPKTQNPCKLNLEIVAYKTHPPVSNETHTCAFKGGSKGVERWGIDSGVRLQKGWGFG